MSCNGEKFLKLGVRRIHLVAKPTKMSLPTVEGIVNASDSKGSITANLEPSAEYFIYVKEISKTNQLHEIHYVTPKKSGWCAWLYRFNFVKIIKDLFNTFPLFHGNPGPVRNL